MSEILIVEDNPDNSELAEKILNHYGYTTVVMPHGKAALSYCENHRPDLILMDLSLPDIDGMEVTRQLRKKADFQHLPIIAITAHAMRGIEEATQEAGVDALLTKPYLPLDLINIIRKHLPQV